MAIIIVAICARWSWHPPSLTSSGCDTTLILGNFLRARSNIVDMPDTVDTVATYGRIHVFLRLRVLAMCWEHPIIIICNIIKGSWEAILPCYGQIEF